MQLSVRDVAGILQVSENTVYRWVHSDRLPANNVCGEYRFNPAELLEWATVRELDISAGFLKDVPINARETLHLADSLRRGGILHRVSGHDRRSAVREIVQNLVLPHDFDRQLLGEALLARDGVGCRRVGDGIAVPHPRYPLILPVSQPAMTLCFLQPPLVLDAADPAGVEILFLLVSPTMRTHLYLVTRLACALHDLEFRELIKRRGSLDRVVWAAQRLNGSYPRTVDVERMAPD